MYFATQRVPTDSENIKRHENSKKEKKKENMKKQT